MIVIAVVVVVMGARHAAADEHDRPVVEDDAVTIPEHRRRAEIEDEFRTALAHQLHGVRRRACGRDAHAIDGGGRVPVTRVANGPAAFHD